MKKKDHRPQTIDRRPQTPGQVVDPLFGLQGRVAVVTGAFGQLGLEYCSALAERGAKVAALDVVSVPRRRHAGFAAGVRAGAIKPYRADITRRGQLERAANQIARDLGVPSILINNAGLDSPPDAPAAEVGPFESYPEASLDRVMDVNVKGTFLCCQVFGRRMARAGRGSIINISSIYGMLSPCQDLYDFRRRGGKSFYKPAAYSVSKSAILNLTRYLATYWAKRGVRVNTLTLAGILNRQPEAFLKAYCGRMPVGRMARAEEAMGPMVFLASEASSYMTGANLVVDGGWSAW